MTESARTGAFRTVMVDTGAVRIGAFRCHPEHPSFADSGPARDFCFVFPRTAVEIRHEHERPFVANPNVVTFYNRGQEYRRAAVSAEGDRCDWFAIDPEIARDVVRAFDPRVDDRPERPFRLTRGESDHATYLAQRELFDAIECGAVDGLEVEERVVRLLESVLRLSYRRAPDRAAGSRDAVAHVERVLSQHWDQALRLRDLASEAGVSMYHLCRTFRQETGRTLHQYRTALRVRCALETVRGGGRLVDIAVAAGFSSHSHFTSAFREAFGRTPGSVRARF
jgi:AraC family transcriptional regulator